mgnify:CR=1 FL=1
MAIQDLGYKGFTSSGMAFRPNETGIGNAKQTLIPRPGNNMIGSVLGAGIDLAQNSYNNKVNNQNIANMQGIYDQQIAAARPGSTTGTAYGNAMYDEATNTLNYMPNQASQGMLGSLYSQQQGLMDQVSNLDPYSLGQQMYDLKRPAMQLAEDRQTSTALERLEATGMLGSTTGNQLQGELAQSQLYANNQALADDILNAQNMKTANFQQQQMGGGLIDNINTGQLNQMNQNIGMGVNVTPPNNLAAAYQNQADSKQSFGEGVGSSLSSMLGLAGGPVGGMIGSVLGKLF